MNLPVISLASFFPDVQVARTASQAGDISLYFPSAMGLGRSSEGLSPRISIEEPMHSVVKKILPKDP